MKNKILAILTSAFALFGCIAPVPVYAEGKPKDEQGVIDSFGLVTDDYPMNNGKPGPYLIYHTSQVDYPYIGIVLVPSDGYRVTITDTSTSESSDKYNIRIDRTNIIYKNVAVWRCKYDDIHGEYTWQFYHDDSGPIYNIDGWHHKNTATMTDDTQDNGFRIVSTSEHFIIDEVSDPNNKGVINTIFKEGEQLFQSPPSLPQVVEEEQKKGAQVLTAQTAGNLKTLVLCGVGCLALLMALATLFRVLRQFLGK